MELVKTIHAERNANGELVTPEGLYPFRAYTQ